jgi:hypothetical protein
MMVAVIIKKRLFLIAILGLAGFILLFLGLRGGLGLETPSLPGVKVITPNTGNVSIEGSEKATVLDDLLSKKGSEFGTAKNQDFFYRLPVRT